MNSKADLFWAVRKIVISNSDEDEEVFVEHDYSFSDDDYQNLHSEMRASSKDYGDPLTINAYCEGCRFVPDEPRYSTNWTLEFPINCDMGKIDLLNKMLKQEGIVIKYKAV